MAQYIELVQQNCNKHITRAENVNVAVPQAGNTTLLEVQTEGLERLAIEVAVVGQGLAAFIVQVKLHPDGSYLTIASVATDYTTPNGFMLTASGNLVLQAAATSGWLRMDVHGVFSVKFLAASGNVAGSTVSVYSEVM